MNNFYGGNRGAPRLSDTERDRLSAGYGKHLAKELADMRQLQQISSRLILENDINQLYNEILDAAIALMRSDMGSMQMLCPERNELSLLAWRGFHPQAAEFWKWVALDSGSTCGKAMGHYSRIHVPDLEICDFVAGTKDLEYYRLCGIRSVQSTPLLSREGQLVGMISTHWTHVHQPTERDLHLLDVLARQAADLIERRKAEIALRESEERLKLAIDAASIGTFFWYMEEDRFEPDERMRKLLDLSEANGPYTIEALTSRVHPDDADRCAEAIRRASNPHGIGILKSDVRVVHGNGDIHWLTIHAHLHQATDAHRGIRMVGTTIDCTDSKTLEQHKNEFIGVASHELKTPVTSIKAYGQLLLERFESQNDKTSAQLIKKLNTQADRLTTLIHELLDSTKLLDGQLPLYREAFDLNKLIAENIADLQCLTQKHQISFEPTDLEPVVADRERIGQVLVNLISNAITYSPNGGAIIVRSEKAEKEAIVRVIDSGIGIPQEQKNKVFDRFYRVNNIKKETFPGLGLGLYISASIIRHHNGTIGVESKQGEGSTFYFTLPY